MVSPWVENGSLPSYLEKRPGTDRCDMSTQICNGVAYLHQTGVIHGDLKGNNVLVSDQGVPVITDFGNAVLEQGTMQFTETVKQGGFTPRWTAPEILEDQVKQSREADVYALGMTILEIITGKLPYYYIRNVVALIKAVAIKKETPKRPEESIPSNSLHGDALWLLLMSCWEQEPEKRPDADEVVEIVSLRADKFSSKANIDRLQMKGVTRDGLMPQQVATEAESEPESAEDRPGKRQRRE
ncbi:hypothetical protein FRC12_003461 [Ceratobasidium sp. 428]|nr:hypothetical protein FRC12_003461 [Ceratobasidium sp. 428]